VRQQEFPPCTFRKRWWQSSFDGLAISPPQLDTATNSPVGYARNTAIKWHSSEPEGLFLAEFLESRTGAQRVPERIELKRAQAGLKMKPVASSPNQLSKERYRTGARNLTTVFVFSGQGTDHLVGAAGMGGQIRPNSTRVAHST
jgi:hypothetical protein